jgi:hypothetical protein
MFFLHYAAHGHFEQGVFAPYTTLEEAQNQAAWDLYNGMDPDMLEGIFVSDWDPPRRGLSLAEIEALDMPHLDPERRVKQLTRSQIVRASPTLARKIVEEAARAQEQQVLDIDRAIREGRGDFSGSVPGNAYTWCTGGTATGTAFAPSTTIKTVILLLAAAANQPSISELSVSFDGVTATAVPVLVELVSSTNATAGTPRVALAAGHQLRGWPAQTSQTTCGDSYTAEPTTKSVVKKWFVSPNGGTFVLQNPLGREPTGIATATTDGKQYLLQVTCPAAVNVHAYLEFEE